MQINNATKGVDLDSSLDTVQNKLQTHHEYALHCYLASVQYSLKFCCFILVADELIYCQNWITVCTVFTFITSVKVWVCIIHAN